MDAGYIIPYIESVQSVFTTMLQLEVACGKPTVESSVPTGNYDVSGIIGMSGDVVGAVVLSFPMATAAGTVKQFVGMEVPTDSEDFGDAIGELVNMIAGGAKAKFEGKTVSIGCPSVVVGSDHKVQQMSDATCISIPCRTSCGDFAIEVSIKNSCLVSPPKSRGAQATA
jgi:chemotaxis protein CheX